MADETTDPTELQEVQSRGVLSAVGAEAVNISSTDSTPSRNDPKGVALIPRALWVGVAGDVKVDMADGSTSITYKNAPIGVLPIQVSKVYKVGTGATDLLYLY